MTGKGFASFRVHVDERFDEMEKLFCFSLISFVINQMDAEYPTGYKMSRK